MNPRWILSLTLSLVAHLVVLGRSGLVERPAPPPEPAVVVVAPAEPAPEQPALPQPPVEAQPPVPQSPPEPEPEAPLPQRFRPNVEDTGDEPTETELQEEGSPEVSQDKPDDGLPRPEEPVAAPAVSEAELKTNIANYRKQLLGQFDEQWQQVPQLNTVVADLTALPRIDKHFGITVLAYSFVEHKPGPPFILFDMENGTYQRLEQFDFDRFSNRIKDRMIYSQYRDKLQQARREHGINALMKVIGLVPTEADRYFSAKQLRAVQRAGLDINQAKDTEAHYEANGLGGYNLIIDAVVAKDGRRIAVQDEELRFSVVARN